MNDKGHESFEEQRGPVLHVPKSLKVAVQIENEVTAAYGVLAFISWSIKYMSREVMLHIYKTLALDHNWNIVIQKHRKLVQE